MSARDKDARAAMRIILDRTLQTGAAGNASGKDVALAVATNAQWVADAMEAARKIRDQAEAPKEPTFTVEHLNGAVAAARCEGRDAGLRNVRSAVMAEAAAFMRDEPAGPMVSRIIDRIDKLIGMTPADPAPAARIGNHGPTANMSTTEVEAKLSALASENAKLRAVAEAAAELVDGMGGFDAMDLRANVKRALAGWRTK